MRKSFSERLFDVCNVLILCLFCLAIILPLLNVLSSSLSSTRAVVQGEVIFWPVELNFDNYYLVFETDAFWRAFAITLFVTLAGTALNMFMTILSAYPLSKRDLRGRKWILLFIIFTMIFQAPLIPTYLLIKELGMINTLWSIIVPTAVAAFNLILCITFFRSLPEELFDAAKVDGMSEYGIVWKIVVPLSMPINVTLILFYAVSHWNNYFGPLVYINDSSLRTLQLYLYYLIAQSNIDESFIEMDRFDFDFSTEGLQMATIITATIPIIMVYPFLQRHFIKGALLGSLKE